VNFTLVCDCLFYDLHLCSCQDEEEWNEDIEDEDTETSSSEDESKMDVSIGNENTVKGKGDIAREHSVKANDIRSSSTCEQLVKTKKRQHVKVD